ncbi:MAG TPA: protein kinase [Kofleriaceae bacterium]|nr:protein kinase [Kofleriaceae bacterium]
MENAGPRQLAPGTKLDDKYRVEQLLAVGGMGAVYLGTHTALRKRVAIKVLNPQSSSKGMIERFHREAITASQIGHEGIAQVTDFGTSYEGEPFLVMEYLEGESLAARLSTSGRLPIEIACELGCAILAPLAAAHEAGIVHRDLKPDNVYLVRQSRGELVKLLDFGISRAPGLEGEFRLTKTGLVLGTPYYMSPEQARGESEVGPAADLYAFGVILYEMLIGRVPIEGENYNQLMFRVLTAEYARPRQERPEIPEELEQLILQSMALDPTARPNSAAELERRLLTFCRPTFRDHQIERLSSSSGLSLHMLSGVTTPMRAPSSGPVMAPVAQDSQRVRADELATLPTEGPRARESVNVTAPTAAAPTVSDKTPAPARQRRTVWIAGAAAVACGVLVGAIVLAKRPDSETAPSPVVETTPTKPQPPELPPAPSKEATPPAKAPTSAQQVPDQPLAVPQITLRFEVEPATATIQIDDRPVKGRQITVPRDDAKHQVKISAPGYITRNDPVSFEENQKLVIQLKRAASGTVRPAGPGRERKPDGIESKSPYDP